MQDRFRERILPELRPWYDASEGFDFENLDEFVPRMNAMELDALREDPAVHAYDRMIPGPPGAPPLKIRVYRPAEKGEGPGPGLLFFHGGGFLFGTVYRQEALCQRYVKNVGCTVISVEYRLAPRWKAPAAAEDGYAALCWVYDHGAEIGIDSSLLALAGLSAGGNIVAAVCMMARDRKGPRPLLQLPLYGELDWRMRTPSSREIIDPKVWCLENNRTSWDLYLGEDKAVDEYDSPALCTKLEGLPPLFSYVGGLDPVRDENMDYWAKLMRAGVPVEGHIFPGAYHCFELGTPAAECSQHAYALTYAALKRAFYGTPVTTMAEVPIREGDT